MTNGMSISGFAINVLDLDRSVEFYTTALGLTEKTKIDLGELHEVLVGGEEDRATILLVKHADRIEHERTGLDQDMSTFEADLRREERDAD